MTTLDALGYLKSDRFVTPSRFDALPPSELGFALRMAVSECHRLGNSEEDVQFEGAYVVQQDQQSPAVPVVFVIRVASDEFSRDIHQFVWNQNQTPFLIIESPSTVRLYSGFRFDRDKDDCALKTATRQTADILEKLASFRAESIDDGTIWQEWANEIDPRQRVDETLLRDLEALDCCLQEREGLDRVLSHGLIGSFIYLRYLRDREILSDRKLTKWGIEPKGLFERTATLKAFHQVNARLQEWLNGSVFSLGEDSLKDLTVQQLRLIASVFQGDSPQGVDELQQTLFDVYDFSHIPIETLSCVYEQFLHDAHDEQGTSRGKTLGAYYTPLPLADYVISELERRRPLSTGTTVLDPACGSGVFLVQCYRRLIERQKRDEERELKASELRELLTEHIFGIDRDHDACRIAELSLILTLLDYVEPPDLENTPFKLPYLKEKNIFQGDFFEVSGPVPDLLAKQQFDWIVGNPPWAEVKGRPDETHEHFAAHRWMLENRETHPTTGNQIAEAFVWKSGQHLTDDGVCGLVVPAMTWFKTEAKSFRQQFFLTRHVWCLANFANLAYVLFVGRTKRPASVVFFGSVPADSEYSIQTFAPFVAEQIANKPQKSNKRQPTWNIIVAENNIREIRRAEAMQGDSLTWKLAMWGTSRDRRLLDRMSASFSNERIRDLDALGIGQPRQGLELRNNSTHEETEKHPELVGKKRLRVDRLRKAGRLFSFPDTAIEEIGSDNCYIRTRGGLAGLAVSHPPHVIVDASRRFAVYSEDFIAVPPRQIGIAGERRSESVLRALSLLLSSEFCKYHQFFTSPKWGIDEGIADLSTLRSFPAPLSQLSESELHDWAQLQRRLAAASERKFASVLSEDASAELKELIAELNDRVYELLGIRPKERWLIEDFVSVQLELNHGKTTAKALRPPKPDERCVYVTALRDCLDEFLSPQRGLRHQIEVIANSQAAMIAVSAVNSQMPIDPIFHQENESTSGDLRRIRDQLRSRHSQWVYFDRGLKVYDQGTLYQFKPLQRLYWTRRQAVLDADEIIAETLAEGAAE